MSTNNRNNSDSDKQPLSELELAKYEELMTELQRKISVLVSNPRTPDFFKEAFSTEKICKPLAKGEK